MKKLLYLMLLILFIQCENEKKNQDCGSIVTENVSLSSDKKSSSKSIPVSYYNCEYVVIMPQSNDSLILKKYLAENKFEQINGFNSSTQLYRNRSIDGPINGPIDTTISPRNPPPPPPPIDKFFIRNTLNPRVRGELVSLFEVITQSRTALNK
jgi:hypothetical protein